MNPLDLFDGLAQRNAMLDRHAVNHREDIQKVRVALLVAARMGNLREITSDDASVIADQLGLPGGERRWVGAVFKGWNRVQATDRMVKSRLARRNARRVMVWQLKEGE